MATWNEIDAKLIQTVDRVSRSVRARLGLSFPAWMAWSTTTVVILMALSVFISRNDLFTVKLPLMALYAVLAGTIIRSVVGRYVWLDRTWTDDTERRMLRSMGFYRSNLSSMRAILGALATVHLSLTLVGAVVGYATATDETIGRGVLVACFTIRFSARHAPVANPLSRSGV